MDVTTYALLKKKMKSITSGISKIEIQGNTLIFTLNNGQIEKINVPVPKDGLSITGVNINNNNHLICTYSNGDTEDAGLIHTIQGEKGDKGDPGIAGKDGEKGADGFSPIVATSVIDGGTKVSITDMLGTHEFNVLNGNDAEIADGMMLFVGVGTNVPKKNDTELFSPAHFIGRKPEASIVQETGLIWANNALYYVTYVITNVSETDGVTIKYVNDPQIVVQSGNSTNLADSLFCTGSWSSDHNTNYGDTETVFIESFVGAKPEVGKKGSIIITQGEHIYYQTFKVTEVTDVLADIEFTGTKYQLDGGGNNSSNADICPFIVIQLFLSDDENTDVGGTSLLNKNSIVGAAPKVNQQGIAFIHQNNHLYYNRFKVTSEPNENDIINIEFISNKIQIDSHELFTIKNMTVGNISELPAESCCIHAINATVGFPFVDDIVYMNRSSSEVTFYTIDGAFMIWNINSETGALEYTREDRWAKTSEVYNKSQVDEKIAEIELTPGPAGADGKSAYQIAVDNGFNGTEEEWLNSLKCNYVPLTNEELQTIINNAKNL